MAFGFYYNKSIYSLNDIYPPYEEELIGWNTIPLKGGLTKIKKTSIQYNLKKVNPEGAKELIDKQKEWAKNRFNYYSKL